MNEILNDLLTLLRCGVNTEKPSEELVRRYQDQTDGKSEHAEKLRTLYQLSRSHFVDALTGTVLKQAGVRLPAEWEQSVAKAIRKVILFDAERAELLKFFEQNKIWYLPLKGIILKEYYPSVGMRQMSDNDIRLMKNMPTKSGTIWFPVGIRWNPSGRVITMSMRKNLSIILRCTVLCTEQPMITTGRCIIRMLRAVCFGTRKAASVII